MSYLLDTNIISELRKNPARIDANKGRILSVNREVAQLAAGLYVPNPRPERDAFIAATALTHGLAIATRNVADFESTGATVFNPWIG